jgi:hypothetical protein
MSAMRQPLNFVQDLQEDPDTGEIKQSLSSPDSINGIVASYYLKFQRLPFFRWLFLSPVVLRSSDGPVKQKDDDKK